jgi:hypothetical protein
MSSKKSTAPLSCGIHDRIMVSDNANLKLVVSSVQIGEPSPDPTATSTAGVVRVEVKHGGEPLAGATAVATSRHMQGSVAGITVEDGVVELNKLPSGEFEIAVYYVSDVPVNIDAVSVELGH